MKLISYLIDGNIMPGALFGDRVVPLAGIAPTLLEIVANWDEVSDDVRATHARMPDSLSAHDVALKAPIAQPPKIMCMGLNYLDHIEEAGLDRPEHQTWFVKTVNTMNGPNDPIPLPKASDQLDYEVELVAVIGRTGKHIAVEDAPSHIFGYAVGNDVSVRDWQLRTGQFVLGKSFDGHAPWGPWITTKDEIPDPHTLDIRCLVNGQLRQKSNTKHLLFNLWDMVHHLSQAMTLVPGDIIFTGTPGGVGWTMDPRQTLAAGDVVRCEIESLGALEGIVTPE